MRKFWSGSFRRRLFWAFLAAEGSRSATLRARSLAAR